MPSIAQIQSRLKEFDQKARKASLAKDPEIALQEAWKRTFSMNLDDASAKSFARYYREMRSKSRSMRGGSHLTPAPLNYQMVPGAAVQTYGHFPVEVDTDPASIRNLDVYFNDSLTKSCGINSSLQVPADMGSNKVGGRRSRVNRKNRKTYKKNKRANRRKNSRKQRGGNMLETLMSRPYLATVPSGVLQNLGTTWNAAPQEPSGNPTVQAWNYQTLGTEKLIDPGLVTPIGADLGRLVNPSPWQTAN
jgi:hypothetical protein